MAGQPGAGQPGAGRRSAGWRYCPAVRLVSLMLAALLVLTVSGCQGMKTRSVQTATPAVSSSPSWVDNATIYEVNVRQYTKEGTFKAFATHLPRLKELGVKVLWFMPIYPISRLNRKGSLGSYYSVADYYAVNPEFGDLAGFKDLVDSCHAQGCKVILDWVGNHTGWDNPWITAHPEWYTQVNGQISSPVGTDWTDVADLNYENKAMRAAMIAAMQFWVKETDIDGFRCDTAEMIPLDFWEDARTALDTIKPVLMLAEAGSDLSYLRQAFNVNYNWELLSLMTEAASGTGTAEAIRKQLLSSANTYPLGSFPMNFTTNHDENSWNGTEFERLGSASELMSALSFTAPGLPLLYSGQEAANPRRLLFFEKDAIDWSDLTAQTFFQKLVQLKKDSQALHTGNNGGSLAMIDINQKAVLGFVRARDSSKVVFIGNFSNKPQTYAVKAIAAAGSYRDYFTGEPVTLKAGSTGQLEGFDYRILIGQ